MDGRSELCIQINTSQEKTTKVVNIEVTLKIGSKRQMCWEMSIFKVKCIQKWGMGGGLLCYFNSFVYKMFKSWVDISIKDSKVLYAFVAIPWGTKQLTVWKV